MKTLQVKLTKSDDLGEKLQPILDLDPHLVFAFGSPKFFESAAWVRRLNILLPGAQVVGCSTGGEISEDGIGHDSLIVTGVYFEDTSVYSASVRVDSMDASLAAGRELGDKLKSSRLKAIFLFGKGLDLNGSAVLQGLREKVGSQTPVVGGLAADEGRFQRTYTVLNGEVAHDRIVAVGVSGDKISVSFGSRGGWEAFGPIRNVTRSRDNILYELDGKPALDIYKMYLGDRLKDLPASGLLFPFQLLKNNQDQMDVVRTILSIDEDLRSLTLAGDIPEKSMVRLMHTTNDDLVVGAREAAELAKPVNEKDTLGLLISCYGRKIVMGVDIDEEVEAVREVLKNTLLTGFYAYGEICPNESGKPSALHNQTMTITTIREAA